jgi:hypothetical protein
MKSLERYINWSKLGAEVSDWHLVRVDAGGEPDRYMSWVEKKSRWSLDLSLPVGCGL